jgi:tetratricopeptide (TPR) repeat protein
MSPEQASGEETDQRSDIYALGIILYEMMTGQVPFEGDTALSVALKHMTEEPSDPRELNDRISEDQSRVILKCLEKGEEARFQSVGELLLELRNIEEGLPLTAGVERLRVPAFLVEGAEEVEGERPVFVAREEELSRLAEFLETAVSGKGRIAFVRGEAGRGKTALIQEFARRAQEARSDLIVAGGNCNAHTGVGDPYLPFREVLALLTGDVEGRWNAGSVSTDHAQRLWHCLPILAQSLVDSGPELIDTFVAGRELLGRAKSYVGRGSGWLRNLKELVEHKAATPADPMLQQSVLLEQFARVLEALAGHKPVLLLLDDLQWADAGSTSLLMHLFDRIQDTRVLVVGAYRPEEVALDQAGERHPLKPVVNECKAKFGDIEVDVGKEGTREFVDAILDTEPNRYGSAFREAFHRHTQGHSLFTIEVFRSLKEQGTLVRDAGGLWTETEVDWGRLPTRVEAMIGERIDRMPENLREVLRVASIEGEYFIGEVLAEVCEGDEKEMMRWLSGELDKQYQLVRAQGIRRIDGQRLSRYRFRHILFQKYLYSTLDEVERAHLHEDVGNVLERRYGENAEEIAAQLARHFQEAGIAEKAIKYLQKAGAEAMRSSAYAEAVSYFGNALELLKKSPATPERTGQELAFQAPIAVALTNLRGYADPGVGEAFSRTYELCKQVGETPEIVLALHGLWAFYMASAQLEPAIALAEQILRLAPKAEDSTLVSLYGHNDQAFTLSAIGEFDRALEHSEKTVCIYEPLKHHRPLVFQVGCDLKGSSLCYSSFALWFLGYPDRGKQRVRDAIAFSCKMAHPYTHSYALFYATVFHQLCRDVQAVQETAAEELRLSTEYGFQMWVGVMTAYQGWVLAEQGRPEEGMAQIREGNAAGPAAGIRVYHSMYLALLVDACVKAGQTEEGLAALEEALALVEETELRFYEAELHRRQGELLLLRGDDEDEVERHYQRAIDVARRQNAKSWELRATTSLARLWQKLGKKNEARKRLAEIYGWFTEGFATPDLKDAKALIKEL